MVAITQSQFYTEFRVDRAERVRFQLKESIDLAAPTVVDVSASTTKVYFRAEVNPPGTSAYLGDDGSGLGVLMTESDAANGKVQADVTFLAVYSQVECSVVIVDEATGSQPTPSTYLEREWKRWHAKIVASKQ